MKDRKRTVIIIAAVILGCAAFLYLGGALGQLMTNYTLWMKADGLGSQTEMQPVRWNPSVCFPMAFTADGIKGMLAILVLGGAVFAYFKLHDKFDGKEYDPR